MKTVGYFEGTDSNALTKLVADGFGTLPLANEWDTARTHHTSNQAMLT